MEKTLKILVILFAAIVVGLFGFYLINQWHNRELSKAREQDQKIYSQRINQLEAELRKLQEEAGPLAAPGSAEMANVFGAEKPVQAETADCRKITGQAVAFFQYLDSKAYTTTPGMPMRSEEIFEDTFRQLSAHPPTNVGEMDNLSTVIRNVTHFYRVMGKDRLILLKDIMKGEAAIAEPAMAVLFAWSTTCNAGEPGKLSAKKLTAMYQYACYFLNTLGGRGYLLRRDSRMRMLISYYSLLLIDMANDNGLNSFGIDIRPQIDYTFYDINNQKALMYRQRYLTHLAALRNKYP